ncbi:Y-box-binding protein 1-like [Pseudophryne corroboree]|uniref:Y-box-binding protein 1-like n=1 Tax=Pseudophryne corroboree TaxID=495146 RepID=UPI0030812DF5
MGVPSGGDDRRTRTRKMTGQVLWFSATRGYGFIRRTDTKRTIYVHYTGIQKTHQNNYFRSLGSGEWVEFELTNGKRGVKAINVTGPNGVPVQGNRHARERNRYWRCPRYIKPPLYYQQDYWDSGSREEPRDCNSETGRPNTNPPRPERIPRPPEPEVPKQRKMLDTSERPVVKGQSETVQQCLQNVIKPQISPQPKREYIPKRQDADYRAANFEQTDAGATDQKRDTEAVVHMAMTKIVEPVESRSPEPAMPPSEPKPQAETPQAAEKAGTHSTEEKPVMDSEYRTITGEEFAFRIQQAIRRSMRCDKGAPHARCRSHAVI